MPAPSSGRSRSQGKVTRRGWRHTLSTEALQLITPVAA
jgi:hypothetical protein